jgi:pimeloyl-ACP methyl ester carboxylesterase
VTKTASTITTRDGVEIYYKDWGPRTGQPVILSHGWPLSSDSWESAAFFLANNGFRVITHDRRGHGRSSQPWEGNDMDHYADDLAQLIEALDLKNIILAGFSTGGGEVARYVGRHGTKRIAKLGLISAVPPLMLKTDTTRTACRSKCSTASAPASSRIAASCTWTSLRARSTTTTVRAPSHRKASSRRGTRKACRAASKTPTTRSRRSRKPTSATT